MTREELLSKIEATLKQGGCLPFEFSAVNKRRGFVITGRGNTPGVYEYLETRRYYIADGVVVMPIGFGNIPGPEQKDAIAEGERYVELISASGLPCELVVRSPNSEKGMVDFAVYVLVPLAPERRIRVGIAGPAPQPDLLEW